MKNHDVQLAQAMIARMQPKLVVFKGNDHPEYK